MEKDIILEVIKERWSPYSFSSAQIEEYKIDAMLTAAGKAPSSNNEQPWLFIYTTRQNSEKFKDFLGFLTEKNRVWAQHVYALIITIARMNFSYNSKPNRHAFHDTGMAVANLLIQATAMNIYVHPMGGFSMDRIRGYFNLKDDLEPVVVMAVGFLGDGSSLPDDLIKKDKERRSRKALTEYSFKNDFPDRFLKS